MDKFIYKPSDYEEITDRIFGAKMSMLFGPDNQNNYTNAMNYLNVKSVRIGDEYAKHFDVSRPNVAVVDNTNRQSPLYSGNSVSVSDALAWAAEHGTGVVVNIPTNNLFTTQPDLESGIPREIDLDRIQDVKDFVKKLLTTGDSGINSLADAKIDAIELGNEYWNNKITSEEYGKLVNILALAVQEAMDELGIEISNQPKIIVQMGSPYSREFSAGGQYANMSWDEKIAQANLDIYSQISDTTRLAIDGLVEHYYYSTDSDILTHGSRDLRSIDVDWAQWANAGYGGKDLYITEWNNTRSNVGQLGLKGASIIIEQVENMLRMGVDAANIWPFQHNVTNLVNGLSQGSSATPRGEAFRLMAESLPGTRLVESNLDTAHGFSYELNAFEGENRFVFFISSRKSTTQLIHLDLSAIVPSYETLEAIKIGFDPTTADGLFDPDNNPYTYNSVSVPNYQDPDALALLTALTDLGSTNDLSFEIGAYEVVRIVMTIEHVQILMGTKGSDSLISQARANKIYGGNGNDYLTGGIGNDTIYGGGGNDLIVAGLGVNKVFGGVGIDTLLFRDGVDLKIDISSNIMQDTGGGFYSISEIENITTGAGNDSLVGNDASNKLLAGAGQDTIFGGRGNDTIDAGDGNDLVNAGVGNDRVFGGNGNDTIMGAYGNDLVDAGLGNDNVEGGEGDDSIFGGRGNDTIDAGDGNDFVNAGVGSDKLFGGNGIDTIIAGSGNDLVDAGSGNDNVEGGQGDDSIFGGRGNDKVDAGDGNDFVNAGVGGDSVFGGNGNDTIIAGSGNDFVDAGMGNDSVDGGLGDDSIEGGSGNDFLFGLEGNDTICGGFGNDTMVGGSGDDRLIGGAGDDVFRFSNVSEGGDTIADYSNRVGDNDRFSIDGSSFGGGLRSSGSIWSSEFKVLTSEIRIEDSTDRFIYDTLTNQLFFDPDGSGDIEKILIANFEGPTVDLHYNDFWLF